MQKSVKRHTCILTKKTLRNLGYNLYHLKHFCIHYNYFVGLVLPIKHALLMAQTVSKILHYSTVDKHSPSLIVCINQGKTESVGETLLEAPL